jgi:hypothetical protein
MAATVSAALGTAEGTSMPCVPAVAQEHGVRVLAMRPDGEVVASADDASIHLWSVARGTLLKTLTGAPPGLGVAALAFTPDGATLMSGAGDGTVKLWRMPEGTMTTTFSAREGGVGAIAIGAAGTLLATGTTDSHGDGTIGLWALPDGRPLKTIAGQRVLHALAFTPDGKTLVSAGNDDLIRLWSVPDGTPLRTLNNTEWVTALALSRDGTRLVSGGATMDGSLRLWSLPAGNLLATRRAPEDGVNALALSSDGKLLVSAGQEVRLWALPGLRPIETLYAYGTETAFEALALDARGRTLAVGGRGYGGTISFFQLPGGAPQPPCYGGHPPKPPKPTPTPDVRPPADLDAVLTGFFSGAIAGTPEGRTAEFSLRTVAGRVSGTYYYSRIDKDIPVSGVVRPDGSFDLQEEGAPGRVTGRFQGRLTREARISGTWTSVKGASREFYMERRVESPRRTAQFPVAPGDAENREVESHGIAYRFYTTSLGHRLPRLTRFRDAGVLKKVNAAIESLASSFTCGEPSHETFGVSAEVHYADADIFSIYVSTSWFCGGAYPTNDLNASVTFDLRNGEIVDFSALFADYERDRSAVLATVFAGQVERARRVKAGSVPPVECDEAFEMWYPETSTYGMSFSTSGLEVQPELAHVFAACAEIVTVPWEKLRPFAAPGSLLTRVLR